MSRRKLALAALLVALAACAGVLGLRPRAAGPFPHRGHVRAGVSCLSCHEGAARAGDHDAPRLPVDADCARCHPKPHDPRPCLGCHGSPGMAASVADSRRHLRFDHAAHVPRAGFGCVTCHSEVARDGTTLRPAMATCFGCHDHAGDWEARACDRCHVDLIDEGVTPSSHVVHDGDWERTHGTAAAAQGDLCASCHAERFCAGCHAAAVPALPARRRFDDPMRASVHRAGFLSRHAAESRGDPGLCTTCHREDFCGGCHADRGLAAGPLPGVTRSPHPPGWVSATAGDNDHGPAARRDPASCASCHGGAGEELCVSCHRVGGVGGSPHPAGWSSEKRLSERPCRLCHTPGAALP